MDLEYLVVGIAKGNEEDFEEFYRRTATGAFSFALVLTGDRILAKEAAAESYRRVVSEAKVFDTGMSALIWHLEIVRNLCLNGMADGEISRQASLKRRENLSILLSSALFGTSEDRGKIIAARLGAGLSKVDAAKLLWYSTLSCAAEYKRGVKQAAELAGFKGEDAKSFSDTERLLEEDLKSATPDYLELAKGGRDTAFSNINGSVLLAGESDRALPGEGRAERQERIAGETVKRTRRRVIVIVAIAAAVLVAVGVALAVFFTNLSRTVIDDPDGDYTEVTEPQYRTVAECFVSGGKVFYSNYADGGAFYVYDTANGSKTKVSDAVPRDFSGSEGDICYFRDAGKGELCSIDVKTLEITRTGIKGALPCPSGGDLFYSSKTGVSKLSGDTVTDIFTDATGSVFRFHMELIAGTVVFSAAPSDGLYRLTPGEDGLYTTDVSFEGSVIYNFGVSGSNIVFENGDGKLFIVDLESGKKLPDVDFELLSGAFCVDGEIIYIYGKTDNGEKGVYRLSIDDVKNGTAPELVLSQEKAAYPLSDIYSEDGLLLLYYSNGEKKGAYNELVLAGADGSLTTIFKNKN